MFLSFIVCFSLSLFINTAQAYPPRFVVVVAQSFLPLFSLHLAYHYEKNRYFQLNPSVSLTWRVLQRAALTFLSYSFIFLVFMAGFTVTGYALFGPKSPEFLSMQRTGVQLFRMVVGGFEYEKMAEANPYLAPIYFLAVAIIGYFILRNLFVAIINDEFSHAASDVRENGFHWLIEDKTNSRAVSRVLRPTGTSKV